MKANLFGPKWLTGHPYVVLLDGAFEACFSTVSQAEWVAVRRSLFLPNCDARRLAPLRFAVVDASNGIVLSGSHVDARTAHEAVRA